ncbi:MAG: DHA2 family efflux MFS transporter permease subunit [Gaiellaceae bacterium]
MAEIRSRRWWILVAFVPATLALGLDATVLSVALPTLTGKLGASTSQAQWFFASYTLVFGAAMVPGGMLGDRFGRKKMLVIALVIFGLGSLACAYSSSPGEFIGARVVLGFGAAIATPMILGALPVLFSEEERPKAIAVIMAATMLGYPIGPILGGWLLTHYWWGWVFLMNLPVVALALVAVIVFQPESRSEKPQRFDPLGIVTCAAGLALLTYGMIEAGQNGWGDPAALAEMIGGLVVLTAFVFNERRVRDPLVDLGLFRSSGFKWGTILATVMSFAMFGLLFAVPAFFQEVLGTDAMGSGMRLLPMIGGLIIAAAIGTRLAERAGARFTVALGFALFSIALGLGATTNAASSELFIAGWIALCGAGIGFAMPTAMDAALGALSSERSGAGSGMMQALRMVGGTFGAAVLGSVLNTVYRGGLDLAGLPASAARSVRSSVVAGVAVAQKLGSSSLLDSVRGSFVHGMGVMLWVCVAGGLLGTVLAFAYLPRKVGKTSEPADGRSGLSREAAG